SLSRVPHVETWDGQRHNRNQQRNPPQEHALGVTAPAYTACRTNKPGIEKLSDITHPAMSESATVQALKDRQRLAQIQMEDYAWGAKLGPQSLWRTEAHRTGAKIDCQTAHSHTEY